MSVVQFYCLFSSIMFLFVAIVLNSTSNFGLILKAVCGILAALGAFSTLASFGVVLASGIRLV